MLMENKLLVLWKSFCGLTEQEEKKREKKRGRGVTTAFSLSFPPSLFFLFLRVLQVCARLFFVLYALCTTFVIIVFFFFFEVDFFFLFVLSSS